MSKREPYNFGREWCWLRAVGDATRPEDLPTPIFDALTGCIDSPMGKVKYYQSRDAAFAALADAERRAGTRTGGG